MDYTVEDPRGAHAVVGVVVPAISYPIGEAAEAPERHHHHLIATGCR